MKFSKLFLFTFIFSIISSSIAFSLTLKTLSLKQMVTISPRIFKGSVVDKVVDYDSWESSAYVTYYTVHVDEAIRGSLRDEITFKIYKDRDDAQGDFVRSMKPPIVELEIGSTYLFFLKDDNEETGLTGFAGAKQGAIRLEEVNGKWMARSLKQGLKKGTVPEFSDYKTLKEQIQTLIEE